jgi:hypothetical protein
MRDISFCEFIIYKISSFDLAFLDINVNFFIFLNTINITFIIFLINNLETMKTLALNLIKYLLGIFSIIYLSIIISMQIMQ